MEQNSVASEEIDAIIKMHDDWRGAMLSRLRIRRSDPQIIEEVKWKKPSKPEGIPVWAHNGNLCMADTLKNAVRITFPKGAQMPDPKGLFNSRMDSKTVRAIDFTQHMEIDEPALSALVLEAVKLNRK